MPICPPSGATALASVPTWAPSVDTELPADAAATEAAVARLPTVDTVADSVPICPPSGATALASVPTWAPSVDTELPADAAATEAAVARLPTVDTVADSVPICPPSGATALDSIPTWLPSVDTETASVPVAAVAEPDALCAAAACTPTAPSVVTIAGSVVAEIMPDALMLTFVPAANRSRSIGSAMRDGVPELFSTTSSLNVSVAR